MSKQFSIPKKFTRTVYVNLIVRQKAFNQRFVEDKFYLQRKLLPKKLDKQGVITIFFKPFFFYYKTI